MMWFRYWSPEAVLVRRYRALLADMHDRGMGPKERADEMAFRHAIVRLRRRATAAVLEDPKHFASIIDSLATAAAKTIADRSVARRFVDVVRSSPHGDILYPAAIKAVDRFCKSEIARASAMIDHDHVAAFTTLR